MKKIYYLSGIILIAALLFFGYYFFSRSNNSELNCHDCGSGGWQRYDMKCAKRISNVSDFKNCVEKLSWNQIDKPINNEEIKEGYIKIGEMDVYDSPFHNPSISSIFLKKVFIYQRIAADESGNLYILTYLG